MDKKAPSSILTDAERLTAWARKLAAGTGTEADEERMEKLVHKHLQSGSDEVFEKAFSRLAEAEEDEAAGELKGFLEFQSESVRFSISSNGKVELGMAVLFAIPVVFLMAPGTTMPAGLRGKDLEAVAKSLRRHGLVEDRQEVFLFPGLYSTDSLVTSLSARWQLLSDVVRRLLGREQIDEPFPRPDLESSSDGVFLGLRYLVGVAILFEGSSPSIFESSQERLDAWEQEMTGLLSAAGNPMRCAVGEPDLFCSALREGVDMFRFEALLSKVSHAISTVLKKGDRCFVSAEGKENGLLFTFRDSGGNLIGEYEFPVLDEDDLNVLLDRLSNFWDKMSGAPIAFANEARSR